MVLGMSLLVIFLVILGGGIIFAIARKKEFNDKLEENINNEIRQFLIEKHNPDYQFKNESVKEELKQQLKTSMIDWRSNGSRYKISYTRRTISKQKEIYSIINKYYHLDKKENL